MYVFRGHVYLNLCIQTPRVFNVCIQRPHELKIYVFRGRMNLNLCIQRSHDVFNYKVEYFRSIQIFVL